MRFNDYSIASEVKKPRGIRVLCVSGEREKGSLCPALDSGLARVATHTGGHRLSRRAGHAVAKMVLVLLAQ